MYHKLSLRTEFQGLPISVENRKGSNRHWYDPNSGEKGKTKMFYPYGYIRGTMGTDGDEVDVFLGPNKSSEKVYIVTQLKRFEFKQVDEQKVMLGFNNAIEAKTAYLQHYDNARFFGNMTEMSMDDFKVKVFNTNGKLIKALKSIQDSAKLCDNMLYLSKAKEFKPVSPKPGSEVGSKTTFTVKSENEDESMDDLKRAQAITKAVCDRGMDLKKQEEDKDEPKVEKAHLTEGMLKALKAAVVSGMSKRQRLDAAYKVGLVAGRNTKHIEVEPVLLTQEHLDIGVSRPQPLYEPPIVPARRVEAPNPLAAPKKCSDHVYKSPKAGPQEAVEFWKR